MATNTTSQTGRLRGLATTLESHRGFADVIASLTQGHGGAIGGTWGSSSALTVAAVAQAQAREQAGLGECGLVVVVLPHPADADAFADDLAIFTHDSVAVLPALETLGEPDDATLADPAEPERLALVKRLTGPADQHPRIIVTTIQALLTLLDDPREVEESTRRLAVGGSLDPAELSDWLIARGWEQVDAIDSPGTFARRGGIVDLFAADWDRPVRIDLFGDEIESLRTFDTVTQRSVDTLPSIDLTALVHRRADGTTPARRTHLADVVPAGSWWALVEPGELAEEARRMQQRLADVAGVGEPEDVFARIYKYPSVTLAAVAPSSLEATATLAVESVERFTGVLDRVREELETVGRDQEVWVIAPSEAEERRLTELLAGTAPDRSGRLHFAQGHLSGGFRLVPEKIVLVGSAELFCREEAAAARAPRQRLSRAIDTFLDLHEGDYVVHVAHGIGRYRGLKLLEKQGRTEEFLEIEFAESTKIYVPASAIDLVQKYVGGGKLSPKLAKVGGALWEKQK
ncbi:MAG: transcription-repair coupling factor, partial [Planctomycetota bacterium]|nr:transcription-repair coupling factor [Planctomycetota bacterium]